MTIAAPLDGVVAVTGATGYIGAVLVRRLLAEGYRVRALSRTPPADRSGIEYVSYDLTEDLSPGALSNALAVVHLAASTGPDSAIDANAEVAALRRLMNASDAIGARFIYISSQSARSDAPSNYGRSKWLGEREVQARGGIIVRPGLVYGGAEKGLFGTLCQVIRRTHVIPVLLPAPQIQPIHVEDLARGLTTVVADRSLNGIFDIAEPRPVKFHTLLKEVASARVRGPVVPIPLPVGPIVVLLGILRPLVGSGADPNRLRSLVQLRRLDTAATLERLGLTLRPLNAGLTRSGGARRGRLIEARTLFRYVLGSEAPLSALTRYVRALECSANPAALMFGSWLRRFPGALVWFDQARLRAKTPRHVLYQRLELATILAETIPTRASRFIPVGTVGGPISRLAGLAIRLGFESVAMIAAAGCASFLAKCLPSTGRYDQ